MARKYKCLICSQFSPDDEMNIIYKGSTKRRIHTEECYEIYIKEEKEKKVEREELNRLVDTIKDLHRIDKIPNAFFPFLQDLRNGNEMFGRVGTKRSKEGYRYKVIEKTYDMYKPEIEWALASKSFQGTLGMLKYTLAIVNDKIASVAESLENQKKAMNKEVEPEHAHLELEVEYNPHNEKDEQDITRFLD